MYITREENFMKKKVALQQAPGWHKPMKICLRVLLVVTTIIYPLFMGLMSAAGWQYNVNEGNYPQLFSTYAFWMSAGSVLLAVGALLCLLGVKLRFWGCNAAALGCAAAGIAACMTVLYQFMAYADQNFPGHRETMQPISEIYRDRLLPMLVPFGLICVLSVWQLMAYDCRVYRSQKRAEKRRREEAAAPRILGDCEEKDMSEDVVILTGDKEQKICQCLKAAGWHPGRKTDISSVEAYYLSQQIDLPAGAKAFLQEFYGIAENWEFRRGVCYDFTLFPYRCAPDEMPSEWMREFVPHQKAAAEKLSGEPLVMLGEIGCYYPARIWLGTSSRIYATYSYNDKVNCYNTIMELILCDFDDKWERVTMS